MAYVHSVMFENHSSIALIIHPSTVKIVIWIMYIVNAVNVYALMRAKLIGFDLSGHSKS